MKFRSFPKNSRWIQIADLPFKKPIVFATLYFGRMLKHGCRWSESARPAANSTPSCSHNFLNIPPIDFRSDPKIARLRYFGVNTTW